MPSAVSSSARQPRHRKAAALYFEYLMSFARALFPSVKCCECAAFSFVKLWAFVTHFLCDDDDGDDYTQVFLCLVNGSWAQTRWRVCAHGRRETETWNGLNRREDVMCGRSALKNYSSNKGKSFVQYINYPHLKKVLAVLCFFFAASVKKKLNHIKTFFFRSLPLLPITQRCWLDAKGL